MIRNKSRVQYCDTAILQYCDSAILRYCNTAILQYCDTTILRYCNTAAKIAFIFTSLSAVLICDFHIFIVVYLPLYGFIWYQLIDQLSVGLSAQMVEHCTGIEGVMGSNPVKGLNFFSGLSFTTAQVVFNTAKIAFIFTFLYIHSRLRTKK